jgi:hypothetical protein
MVCPPSEGGSGGEKLPPLEDMRLEGCSFALPMSLAPEVRKFSQLPPMGPQHGATVGGPPTLERGPFQFRATGLCPLLLPCPGGSKEPSISALYVVPMGVPTWAGPEWALSGSRRRLLSLWELLTPADPSRNGVSEGVRTRGAGGSTGASATTSLCEASTWPPPHSIRNAHAYGMHAFS